MLERRDRPAQPARCRSWCRACDDCISLFLGSADRYRELFRKLPGVYWYNTGWIEQALTPVARRTTCAAARNTPRSSARKSRTFLMECTNNWMVNYRHCGYITCPLGEREGCEAYARQAAADFGWAFTKVEGDMGLSGRAGQRPVGRRAVS